MKPASISYILFLFPFLSWALSSSSSSRPQSDDPNGKQRIRKRCTFVDDGFAAKDCGHAPTKVQFEEFVKKQAGEVALLEMMNPCGFTSCPKFKRDLEFDYRSRSDPKLVARHHPPAVKQKLQSRKVMHENRSLVKRDSSDQARPRHLNRRLLLAADLRYEARKRNAHVEEALLSRHTDEQPIVTLAPRQPTTFALFTDKIPANGLFEGTIIHSFVRLLEKTWNLIWWNARARKLSEVPDIFGSNRWKSMIVLKW